MDKQVEREGGRRTVYRHLFFDSMTVNVWRAKNDKSLGERGTRSLSLFLTHSVAWSVGCYCDLTLKKFGDSLLQLIHSDQSQLSRIQVVAL